mmetsp:Transcript_68653/g.183241  ORF Transcript_68653/g.183241 Transcript_68653/m.183241 type:complete len:237 (-) Transcript_68653:2921-3631(-)
MWRVRPIGENMMGISTKPFGRTSSIRCARRSLNPSHSSCPSPSSRPTRRDRLAATCTGSTKGLVKMIALEELSPSAAAISTRFTMPAGARPRPTQSKVQEPASLPSMTIRTSSCSNDPGWYLKATSRRSSESSSRVPTTLDRAGDAGAGRCDGGSQRKLDWPGPSMRMLKMVGRSSRFSMGGRLKSTPSPPTSAMTGGTSMGGASSATISISYQNSPISGCRNETDPMAAPGTSGE